MVLFDSKFRRKYRKAVKQSRAERIRCVRLRNGLYYVARRASGHGEYLVSVNATNSGMFGTCRTVRGASCPAYGVCVHLATVFERMIAEGHRIGRREAA